MRPILMGTAIVIAGLAATVGIAVPAGSHDPFRVRIVTMEGRSGPAYYSAVSHRYRFLTPMPEAGVVAELDAPAR